ncbi:MAG: hypothetical protein LBB48_07235 [Treponema sp.]|jgi:hypothetical protein|nr:hypothetical protein [Treponema sp.]
MGDKFTLSGEVGGRFSAAIRAFGRQRRYNTVGSPVFPTFLTIVAAADSPSGIRSRNTIELEERVFSAFTA